MLKKDKDYSKPSIIWKMSFFACFILENLKWKKIIHDLLFRNLSKVDIIIYIMLHKFIELELVLF